MGPCPSLGESDWKSPNVSLLRMSKWSWQVGICTNRNTQSDTVLDASDSGDYDVIWYLNTQSSSSSEDDATVYSGNPITITVPAAGIYNLTMKVFDKKSLYLVDSRDTLLASK
jgi:hypothetical protein